MAGVLGRILCKRKFIVPPKRNPLTLSLSTLADTVRFEKEGWEYSARMIGRKHPESHWKEMLQSTRPPPTEWNDDVFSIKHLESGITFRFCAYDAICKWRKEKETMNPLASDFPSYASPLYPFGSDVYDSAYVGRVLIEKPGEVVQSVDLNWQDIDQNTLEEQIVWTTKNKPISAVPNPRAYFGDDGQASFFNHKREAKKSKTKIPNRKGLPDPLLNTVLTCYRCELGRTIRRKVDSSCTLFLVVTESGWFAYLNQLFFNKYGARRIRDMTMHCAFKQNVIYREITESQSKDFLKRLSKDDKDMSEKQANDMIVLFHEAKQFQILETNMQGVSEPQRVHDATQCGSFAIEAPGDFASSPGDFASCLIDLPLPDSLVESLVATGKPIQILKAAVGNYAKIIPLFTHPCNPCVPSEYPGPFPRQAPRKAYINNLPIVLNASNLANLLER